MSSRKETRPLAGEETRRDFVAGDGERIGLSFLETQIGVTHLRTKVGDVMVEMERLLVIFKKLM